MDAESLVIRLVLGMIVGLGFVASSVWGILQYVGMSRSPAMFIGVVVGFAVLVLVVLKTERVRD
ncbi:hypothetical protein ACFQE8_17175 [Salinirubellus sp. GCM10025818]|jgi:hypothetical protein|uniref:hypothetical protein n=1 Tax=Salinirubellus TaxID=2162630 RepID=UPI0030CC523D